MTASPEVSGSWETLSLQKKKVTKFSVRKAIIRMMKVMVQPIWLVLSPPPKKRHIGMTTELTVMVPKVASSIRKLPSRPRSY